MSERVWNSDNLDYLMNKSGVTTKQIAEITGMSLATANQWRQGYLQPSLRAAMLLADFFAVPMDYLVGRCDLETAKEIEQNYAFHFKQLRTDAFELYLKTGHKTNEYDCEIIATYPYNMLEDLFGEPWTAELNPLQENGLKKALSTLTDREKNFLFLYYNDELNLEAIGGRFGLTRERVRQIVHKALRKMRHPARARLIKEGYDEHSPEKFLAAREKDIFARIEDLEAKKKYVDELERKLNGRMAELGRDPEQLDIKRTSITLDDMGLSVRSYNCLLRAGIRTLQDILDYPGDYSRIRNLGKKCLEEIRETVLRMADVDICSIERRSA